MAGVAGTRYESARAITFVKNGQKKTTETTCTFSYDKMAIYKISNQSDERLSGVVVVEKDWTDRKTDGMKDGQIHTQTDEGHFYSPPLPMSGENE